MASRVLFNSQLASTIKRAGARFQSTASHSEFFAEREAVKKHAAGWFFANLCTIKHFGIKFCIVASAETWKKISIFVCIPAYVSYLE